MAANDRDDLLGFIDFLSEQLPGILDQAIRELVGDPELAALFEAAWRQVVERDEFGALRAAVESASDIELARAGLTGFELRFKMDLVRDALAAVRRSFSLSLVRQLLRFINVPLSSMVALFGAGEGIKELKDGVEAVLKFTDRGPAAPSG